MNETNCDRVRDLLPDRLHGRLDDVASARLEKHLIQLALDRTGGNKTQAAELLELSPRALRYKIQEYGIE